jgi:hypothetical protein
MDIITLNDFSKYVRDKKDLYQALQRNGFYLPSLKSSMIRETYLIGLLENRLWCPKVNEIRLGNCPRPP